MMLFLSTLSKLVEIKHQNHDDITHGPPLDLQTKQTDIISHGVEK